MENSEKKQKNKSTKILFNPLYELKYYNCNNIDFDIHINIFDNKDFVEKKEWIRKNSDFFIENVFGQDKKKLKKITSPIIGSVKLRGNGYDIFDFCEKISINAKEFIYKDFQNKFNYTKETIMDSVIIFFEIYSKIFSIDYISIKTWVLFSKAFHLTIPKSEMYYWSENENENLFLNYFECIDLDNDNINEIKIEDIKKSINLNSKVIENINYWCETSKRITIAYISSLFRYNPNAIIKKCHNCGKWFTPKKSDTKYCDRISHQYKNKTCKEAMITINKLKNEKSSELRILKKRIYNKYLSTYSTYQSEEALKELNNFKKEKEKWDKNLKVDLVTTKQYIDWLNSNYKRKKV